MWLFKKVLRDRLAIYYKSAIQFSHMGYPLQIPNYKTNTHKKTINLNLELKVGMMISPF